MMITRNLLVSLVTLHLCSSGSFAQFSSETVPVGMMPTYYNGGFAGEAGAPRVAIFSYFTSHTYRLTPDHQEHWRFSGSYVSVDHFVKNLRSGIAVTTGYIRQSQDLYDQHQKVSNNFCSIAISPKISSKGKYTLAPFADFYFGHKRDTLADDMNYFGKTITAGQYHWNDFGIKTGFLVNSDKAYVGLSAQILNYTQSPYADKSLNFFHEVVYALQMGHTFQRKQESKFSFTLQLVFWWQRYQAVRYPYTTAKWHLRYEGDLNLVFRYTKFIAGLNFTGVMVGYQNNKFKLQISNFWSREAYSGSISLRYTFRKNGASKMPGF